MLHTVRLMQTDDYVVYVHVLAFDFSKAFDTVRHASLMNKLAQLAIPDSVYNWVVDFFQDHAPAHCTKYAGIVYLQCSSYYSRQRVIQGSALGPGSYTVTAADLHTVYEENRTFKFADDTYLAVPAINTDTCQEEIDHLQTWAAENNLKLN